MNKTAPLTDADRDALRSAAAIVDIAANMVASAFVSLEHALSEINQKCIHVTNTETGEEVCLRKLLNSTGMALVFITNEILRAADSPTTMKEVDHPDALNTIPAAQNPGHFH